MEHKPFKCPQPVIRKNERGREKWLDGVLVMYPTSITYNGGTVIDGEWYSGYEVPQPKIPKGYELVSIYCGDQLNNHPPLATRLLRKKT